MSSHNSLGVPSFSPAWYCLGPHLQSVWGYFFRKHPQIPWRRERWDTPDGDFLDIDFLDTGASDAPTLLVLHGLEGSSGSHYVRGTAEKANVLGWRTAALNFRSCSGVENRKPRFYHCGETGDLDFVVNRILERFHGPLALVGFSLGGSVLLKWLGEHGETVSSRICGAVGISVSFAPAACARVLDSLRGYLFRWHLLTMAKRKAYRLYESYPRLFEIDKVRGARTFHEFDRLLIAPLYGFRDEIDYYEKADSSPYLPRVCVRTLILSSEDDPIVPSHVFPRKQIEESRWLKGILLKKGGHVGFVSGRDVRSPIYWGENRALEFLETCLKS